VVHRVGFPTEAGQLYGTFQQDEQGRGQWHLIAGATLVEAAYLARQRHSSSPQVAATFSRGMTVNSGVLSGGYGMRHAACSPWGSGMPGRGLLGGGGL
jgi:hypothetical protein